MPSTDTARLAAIEASLRERLAATGALLEGHFLLSSGRHSDRYIQCARLLQHPAHAEWACRALADRIAARVDVVLGPALGGVIVAHELARALGVRAVFAEREAGEFRLRRGFTITPGERVLVAEDVVTTGLSVREAAHCAWAAGGEVVAVASLVDRSAGTVAFDVPFHALLALTVETWTPDLCPACAAGVPAMKPGSRARPALAP